MQNTKLYSLTLIAIGAAIIAVLSPLAIPIGIVPITLQTLAVGLVATVLKARETFFAILIYLILGFIGIPVFTGGTSGIAVLFGATGGFLVAFLFIGTLISWGLHKIDYKPIPALTINIIGHILMLLVGTLWIKLFMNIDWTNALRAGFTPFLFVEIIKAVLVTIFGLAIIRALSPVNKYFTN
ncbi:MAG: biotin transporter BioY [Streptococcaceae bacterium]|nr:biotin transporter BioY [Streptococcaceae bacterium]